MDLASVLLSCSLTADLRYRGGAHYRAGASSGQVRFNRGHHIVLAEVPGIDDCLLCRHSA